MDIINFLKNRRGLVTFLIVVLFLTLIVIYSFLTKPKPIPEPTSPFTVTQVSRQGIPWNGIAPGGTSLAGIPAELGPLVTENDLSNGNKELSYEGKGGKYLPTVVISDREGVVEFIRVPQVAVVNPPLLQYIQNNNLGAYDFEMYVGGVYRQKIYVFLSKGIALEANEFSGEILYMRYFVPTTKEDFLSKWGTDLSETYTHPGN